MNDIAVETMIAALCFSLIAASLVYLAGRKDSARDAWLSAWLLGLLVVFPVLYFSIPKLAVFPAAVASGSPLGLPWQKGLLAFWFVGFAVCLARLLKGVYDLEQWRKSSVQIHRQEGVEIRQRQGLRSPVAAGIIRPVIFVPESWAGLPEETKDLILAHEMIHHRRRDPLWRLIAMLACAIYWYHPLVHWMAQRLAQQCEFDTDAAVVDGGASPASYARVLCDLAENSGISGNALAMADASSLEVRIRRLMEGGSHRTKGHVVLIGIFIAAGIASSILLASLGTRSVHAGEISAGEVDLRLTADPFPGN